MSQSALIGTIPRLAATVPGSGVYISDPGGVIGGGPITLEDLIALLPTLAGLWLTVAGGGKGTVQSLGNLGATETIDLANANYFAGTLDANCAIGFTGWTNLKDCQIVVETTVGVAGSIATFSGITWIGGIAPTPDTAAGTVALYVFMSRDGGTTIYGALLGGSGGTTSDAMVPYLIEAGETFTVPVKKQALWTEAITVDAGGTLAVDGYLLMVT